MLEQSVKDYLSLVASDSPSPGGGSCSAFMGAQGAALLEMVCGLTLGKRKYAEFSKEILPVKKQAEDLRLELLELAENDAEAYSIVFSAYQMPKSTAEEMEIREKAIQDALETATLSPLGMMIGSLKVLELIRKVSGKTNKNAESDLRVAAYSAFAGVHGAYENVQINLASLTDEEKRMYYHEKAECILKEAHLLKIEMIDPVGENTVVVC